MDTTSADLLGRWRDGDRAAAEELFDRYTDQLLRLARRQLPPALAARVDPEDVIQSVYRSFFADALTDRYVLQRSGDLWRLLTAITLHKVHSQIELHTAAKRTVKREQPAARDTVLGLPMETLARDPSPSEAASLADELEWLLRDSSTAHRTMIEMRLQGHTFDDIAAATQRSERLVRRVLEQFKARLEERCRDSSCK
jgi:RNA polymerase sigma-70 factor (ECF subfamily)